MIGMDQWHIYTHIIPLLQGSAVWYYQEEEVGSVGGDCGVSVIVAALNKVVLQQREIYWKPSCVLFFNKHLIFI